MKGFRMLKHVSISWLVFLGLTLGCFRDLSEGSPNPGVRFNKHAEVFGIDIYATPKTGNDKIIHAANVLAEYLDSDEDGVPNNQEVVDFLVEDNSVLLMTQTELEFEQIAWDLVPDHGFGQGLYDDETHPDGAAQGIFDASLEEVLHLVTWGYINVYPEVFGDFPGSQIALAMDEARGGHFEQVPDAYPQDAWYTYYDETCDYGCQIFEYFYWALTSILGAQDFPGRLEQIDDEWRLNTLEKVMVGDPAIYALMTDPLLQPPTQLPDGKYNAQTFSVKLLSKGGVIRR